MQRYTNPYAATACCNARTMATVGPPPYWRDYDTTSCCNVYAQNQADVLTAKINADRMKALARLRVA